MFDYTVESFKSMNEVVSALEGALKERGFGVLWDLDLTGTLQAKGIDFTRPYRILEVCSPQQAKQVLDINIAVGYFLPCKIVVYEDAGVTKIGLPKPTAIIGLVGEPGMQDIAEQIETTLKGVLDAVK